MRRPLALVLLALSLAAVGCGHTHSSYRSRSHTHHHSHTTTGEAVALGILTGAAIVAAATDPPRPPPEPVVVRETLYVPVAPPAPPPPPLPPSPRDRAEPATLPSFDPIAARVALSAVDVGACRDAGVPSGTRGHAFVTVDPDGTSSKVVVDEPSGLPPAGVECVGLGLGAIRVKPFRGSHVTVGTTWRVP